MASETDIKNLALTELGAARIIDPASPTEHGRLMGDMFPMARDQTLRAHPWNFARRRTTLAALSTPPAFDFANQFTLPTNPFCLRAWQVGEETDRETPWAVEGRKLLTDLGAPLQLRYIARIEDTSQYDPIFIHALALRLAAVCAFRITSSRSAVTEMWKRYKEVVVEARGVDGQEGTPEPQFRDDWLNARL